jgi:hypothetical protein
LEELVRRVRALEDIRARDTALELVQVVMDLHGAALERTLALIAQTEGGGAIIDQLAHDPAVSPLLLLHDLHPVDLETRVRRAVEQRSLARRGCSARVVSVADGQIRLRVEGDAGFAEQVRAAIVEAAPDAGEVLIESEAAAAPPNFVPLEQLLAR